MARPNKTPNEQKLKSLYDLALVIGTEVAKENGETIESNAAKITESNDLDENQSAIWGFDGDGNELINLDHLINAEFIPVEIDKAESHIRNARSKVLVTNARRWKAEFPDLSWLDLFDLVILSIKDLAPIVYEEKRKKSEKAKLKKKMARKKL